MKHFFIPDTQVKPGVKTDHLEAAGNYVADKRPDKIICIGDWWDMPSLSAYDKAGEEGWELKDVAADFESGNEAMELFMAPIRKAKDYHPKLIFTFGNHEERRDRACKDPLNRKFKAYLGPENFNLNEWKTYPYLKPVNVDGILYCHTFEGVRGMVETRIKTVGNSFVAGHEHTYMVGAFHTSSGQRRRGLVCGSFYQHDEKYVGFQKNKKTWRGCFMLNEVKNGDYDLLEISLKYLMANWL
jgi:hypothetical protein